MSWISRSSVAGAALCLAALATPALAETDASAPVADPAVLPTDADALRSLEHQHRRIVRTAIRRCASGKLKQRGIIVNPCVISGVIRGIELADNPQLAAYDEALPMQARYDERRPQSIWRTVAKRHAEANAQEAVH